MSTSKLGKILTLGLKVPCLFDGLECADLYRRKSLDSFQIVLLGAETLLLEMVQLNSMCYGSAYSRRYIDSFHYYLQEIDRFIQNEGILVFCPSPLNSSERALILTLLQEWRNYPLFWKFYSFFRNHPQIIHGKLKDGTENFILFDFIRNFSDELVAPLSFESVFPGWKVVLEKESGGVIIQESLGSTGHMVMLPCLEFLHTGGSYQKFESLYKWLLSLSEQSNEETKVDWNNVFGKRNYDHRRFSELKIIDDSKKAKDSNNLSSIYRILLKFGYRDSKRYRSESISKGPFIFLRSPEKAETIWLLFKDDMLIGLESFKLLVEVSLFPLTTQRTTTERNFLFLLVKIPEDFSGNRVDLVTRDALSYAIQHRIGIIMIEDLISIFNRSKSIDHFNKYCLKVRHAFEKEVDGNLGGNGGLIDLFSIE